MTACQPVDQLSRDAYAVTAAAHAALEHEAHAQLSRHAAHVDALPLIGESGVAGDNEQPWP